LKEVLHFLFDSFVENLGMLARQAENMAILSRIFFSSPQEFSIYFSLVFQFSSFASFF